MSKTPSGAGLFLRMPDGLRGPFGLDTLRELAADGVISPETIVGDSEEGPWIALGRYEIADELFKARRVFGFKDSEFVRANTQDSQPVDHNDLIWFANQRLPAQKQEEPQAERPPNDVQELVRSTTAANAAREPPMVFVKRQDRRRRDFIYLIAVGDGVGAVLLFVVRNEPLPMVLVAGCMGIYTTVVTWILFGVMDRY
jgi:hypothetical protein